MRLALPALLLLGAAAIGCAGAATATMETTEPPRPLGQAARGGSLVIDPARFVAWIADADNRAVHRVDLISYNVVTTPMEGAPEQVALAGDGMLAVTLRDRNQVALLAAGEDGALTTVATAEVACDPFGLAVTPQGEILVTSGYCHAVTALDAETLAVRWSADVAREPRAVVVTTDGARAFVTHVVGDAVTVLDLDDPAPTPRRVRALGGLYRNRVDEAIGAGTLHPAAALAYAAVLSESGSRLFVPHLAEQNGESTARAIPGAYGGVPVEEETSFASVAVIATRGERAVGGGLGIAPREALVKGAFVAADRSARLRGGAGARAVPAGARGGDRRGSAARRVAGDGRGLRARRAGARSGDERAPRLRRRRGAQGRRRRRGRRPRCGASSRTRSR